jgi:TolB protein
MKKIIFTGLILTGLLLVGGCDLLQQKGPQLANWEPVLSSDGTTLAYASPGEKGFEIYTLNIDTGEIVQLTQNEVDDWAPSWSPQGDRLVFSSNRDKNVDLDLYLIDIRTLDITRLTTDESEEVNPYWGVNDKILFNSSRSGVWEVYMIDYNGQNLTKITETPASE